MQARTGIVVALVVALLAACGNGTEVTTGASSTPVPLDEHVVLTSADAVYRVPTGGGTPRHWAGAVAAADRSSVVAASWDDATTSVAAVGLDDTLRWSDRVAGQFGVRVVSADGRLAALGPGPATGTAYTATARTTTPIVVLGAGARRELVLEGNFEPEAFTSDGRALVLIEYLPTEAPTSYSIARLDLTTGAVSRVHDADGAERPPMRGTARTSVASADGRRLYTYYVAPEGAIVHGRVHHAFVHVLDLEEQWAHCVGLEAPFGGFEASLGLDETGRVLVVADVANHVIARLDTTTLHVDATGDRFGELAAAIDGAPVPSVSVGPSAAYLGAGHAVQAFDLTSLEPSVHWRTGNEVLALRVDESGTRLYVSVDRRVVVLDVSTMRAIDWIDVPEAFSVRSADPRSRPVPVGREEIQCAC